MQELGKYEIVDEIGRGSYGVVYKARDTTLDREVALKVLHPQLLTDRAFVRRFQREAQALARLDHPNIVTVYDAGEDAGQLYIAMRLVRGTSLAATIADRDRIPWQETLALLEPVCRALDYAHSRGVVHRDLKPANILLDEERGPMLADFGIARLVGTSTASLTVTGGIVGTPAYIAPEVWGKGKAKAPADIYALGCIAYEMLAGEVLFPGDGVMQVIGAHYNGPQFPAQWPEGVPGGAESILGKALAREPEERFASAGKVVEALRAVGISGRRPAEARPKARAEEKRVLPAILSPTQPFEPEMVLIPAGKFLMGSDPGKDTNAFNREQPQHELYLPDYYIAKTPVTEAHYWVFVEETGYESVPGLAPVEEETETGYEPVASWSKQKPPRDEETHPVAWVSWSDAIAYCKWLTEATGKPFRLPTEAEWEKAARGTDGNIYPWGNQWDPKRCNTKESGIGGRTPVDSYPNGASPYGVLDMAGNVCEWTSSLGRPYPYDGTDRRKGLDAQEYRVARGGSWNYFRDRARCACRLWHSPDSCDWHLGFRVVVSPG